MNNSIPEIPTEIVSGQEMALLDTFLAAASSSSLSSSSISAVSSSSSVLAAASSSSHSSSSISAVSSSSAGSPISSSQFQNNVRSILSITRLSKRRLHDRTDSCLVGDMEDLGDFRGIRKRLRVAETSLFHRFRRKKGLSVTDIRKSEWCEKKMEFSLLFDERETTEAMGKTGRARHAEVEEQAYFATHEWCEKQMEFVLQLGKPEITKAMKAGSARHAELEEEVVKRVRVHVESKEDRWALKFMNFIVGTNQLMFEGLTRELPLIGFTEGVWMVGVIDEIRMPVTDSDRNPILVDTKTRVRDTLPGEAQQRNGRLQLMCYKYLWDNLVADKFPSKQFFDFFTLNPHHILSEEIRENTANFGFPAKTLDDLVRYYKNACCMLPPAHDELLLRYEFQQDHSLLGEDQFAYDSGWLKSQIQCSLEFWLGEREANYTPEEERWKCRCCKFASVCPANVSPSRTPS